MNLFLLVQLLVSPLQAQELSYEASSEIEPQHRIHSIPRDSVRSLLQGERDLKAFALRKIDQEEALDTVPFKSFKSSADPAFGYYLHSTWDEKEFQVKVEQVSPFELFAFPSYERHYLFIEKMRGSDPSSLQVFQGSEELSYKPSMNAYPLRDEEGLVRVEWEGEAYYFLPHREEDPKPRYTLRERFHLPPFGFLLDPFRKLIYNLKHSREAEYSYTPDFPGYFVTNKPRYRPGDTLFWKAYLLDENNKGMDEKLILSLKESYGGEKRPLDTVQAVRPGVYYGSFPVPDSLTLDKKYVLFLGNEDRYMRSNSVKYGDQSLDEENLGAELLYDHLPPSEPIRIALSAQNSNGRPLQGAHYEVWVLMEEFKELHEEATEGFIPDTLFHGKGTWSGEDTLSISDSLLPPADMDLEVQLRMHGPSGRVHEMVLDCELDDLDPYIHVEDKDTVLKASLVRNGERIEGKGEAHWVHASGSDTLREEVRFPYEWRPEGPFDEVLLKSRSSSAAKEVDMVNFHSEDDAPPYMRNIRLGSKIGGKPVYSDKEERVDHYLLKNPRRFPMRYQLFDVSRKKPLEVGSFTDRQFRVPIPDNKNGPFLLRLQYVWGGEERKEKVTFDPDRVYDSDSIGLLVDGPDTVHPGDSAHISVQALNKEKERVEGMELTAWAFSWAFQDFSHKVHHAYRGRRYGGLAPSKGNSIDRYYKSRDLEMQSQPEPLREESSMSDTLARRLPHQDEELFHLYHPSEGYAERELPFQGNGAQFAPFVTDGKGNLEEVLMVQVDGVPVHFHKSDFPYSFRVEEGEHAIRIRTRDRAYTIDSVRFREGVKLEFSINEKNPPDRVEVDTVPDDRFLPREFELLKDSWARFELEEGHQDALFAQQGSFRLSKNPAFEKMGILDSRSVWAGPFYGDSLSLLIQKVQGNRLERFRFEAGMDIKVQDQYIRAGQIPEEDYWSGHSNSVRGHEREPGTLLASRDRYREVLSSERFSDETSNAHYFMPSVDLWTAPGKGRLLLHFDTSHTELPRVKLSKREGSDSLSSQLNVKGSLLWIDSLQEGRYRTLSATNTDTLDHGETEVEAHGVTYRRLEMPAMDSSEKEDQEDYQAPYYKPFDVKKGLAGRVFDTSAGDGAIATLTVFQNGEKILEKESSPDGFFHLPLDSGIYDIKAQTWEQDRTLLKELQINREPLFINLPSNYHSSLIQKLPGKSASKVATTGAGRGKGANRTSDHVPKKEFSGELAQRYDEQLRANIDREYAYWEPDIITDEEGKASFDVRFPGKITTWKNFLLGKKGESPSFFGSFETRVMKAHELRIFLPRYLRTGDSASFNATALNSTDSTLNVRTSFSWEDSIFSEQEYLLEGQRGFEASLPVPRNPDTPMVKGVHLKEDGSFLDGLERKLPITDHRIRQKDGRLFVLEGDSIATLSDSLGEGEYSLKIKSSRTELIEEKLKEVRDYPHACNEQVASRLRVLLASEKHLGKDRKKKKLIEKMIQKLFEAQNDEDAWGWWPSGSSDLFFTAYVWNALQEAQEQGYELDGIVNLAKYDLGDAKDFLYQHLRDEEEELEKRLYAALVLARHDEEMEVEPFIRKFDREELSPMNKLRYSAIASEGRNWDGMDELLEESRTTATSGRFWSGAEGNRFHSTDLSATMLAYQAIRNAGPEHESLEGIRRYVFHSLQEGGYWNTFDGARTIRTLLPDLPSDPEKEPFSLELNGALDTTLQGGAHSIGFEGEGEALHIESSSSRSVYVMLEQEERIEGHKPDSNGFQVKSGLKGEKSGEGRRFQEGEQVDLELRVEADAHSSHVMIEVPIPSGMEYRSRPQWGSSYQAHREYYKERTYIFCDELPEGEHRFSIPLSARFKGSYIMPPSSASLMYFPVVNGRDVQNRVFIGMDSAKGRGRE